MIKLLLALLLVVPSGAFAAGRSFVAQQVLGAGSVTTASIANGSVTTPKLHVEALDGFAGLFAPFADAVQDLGTSARRFANIYFTMAESADGSASGPSYGFSNDANTGMYRIANDELGFTTAGTQELSINDSRAHFSGNVGIGTDSPATLLTLAKDGVISTDGTDGNDTGQIALSGGGALGSVRGASVVLAGNEDAKTGNADISAGNIAGGEVTFATGGSVRVTIANTLFTIVPQASAPASCEIGDLYIDTSGAACACASTNTWENMIATGTCS